MSDSSTGRHSHQLQTEHAPKTFTDRDRLRLRPGRTLSKQSLLGLLLTALLLATGLSTASPADAATIGLREQGTGLTEIIVGEGDTVSLELYLDTEGLSFTGYMIGVDITGGGVSGIGVAHQDIGLFPDLFTSLVIDEGLDTIRSINQISFTTTLAAGFYVLDIITLTVDTYASNFDPEILVTPGLFGESLGLGGGACPGNVEGCTVSVSSASIVPEPSTALLVGLGLVGLGVRTRSLPQIPSPI